MQIPPPLRSRTVATGHRASSVVAAADPGGSSAAMELQARAGEAAALLKALANPDRLMLLCLLLEGERGVGELGDLSGLLQPSLSQQLSVLRAEHLVTTRREGKHVVYRLASPAAVAVLNTLHGLFCDAAPSGRSPRPELPTPAGRKAPTLIRKAS